jgi:hypothetical protein
MLQAVLLRILFVSLFAHLSLGAAGLYDSVILVVPSLDRVVARAGESWPRNPGGTHYDPLRPFFEPMIAAVNGSPSTNRTGSAGTLAGEYSRRGNTRAAVPALPATAPLIKGLRWAPVETIRRAAKGSDNWPITWADDDTLYGAFGDGNGFEPFTPEKLSLGFARIDGGPDNFRGENLRAPSLEARGDGNKGRKASGLLCVKGVLYLWARNAGNSQLAWSADHGRTWTWGDWKFTNSFGCPTFVNFGRDYGGNRDGFAYTYSPDSNDAYSVADQFVLARAPVNRIREREAYEFFAGRAADGSATWATNLHSRAGVLTREGMCYRPGVTFSPALNRFLLVHSRPNERSRDAGGKIDLRFQGGLAIYEAPQPWGPWSVVFDTDNWDAGPGDSASFPAKWMSADGRTLYLVFSGDDCFSVRKATLVLAGTPRP